MKLKSEPIERILWILAISLALVLRLLNLGVAPLTDWEAANALPVFEWLKSGTLPAGSQAAYALFSGLIFYLSGASNFAARFIPALAGSLLVLAPWLFRRQLGRWPAVVAAFGLALDPTLLAISRQADGSAWAITLSLFAIGFWLNRRNIWAGICFGLALLGGPALWPGWLALGIAALLSRKRSPAADFDEGVPQDASLIRNSLSQAAIAAGVTLVLAGTLFLFAPFGLSMAVGSLPAFLQSWTQTGAFSLRNGAIALLSYATLPLVLGILQVISGWSRKDALDRFLSIWLALALLLWFACPGRQLGTIGWAMIPLWMLAARQAVIWLRKPAFDARFTAIMAVIVFVLLFFIVMNVAAIVNPLIAGSDADVPVIKIVVACVLLGLSIVLIGWGWNWDAAGEGVQWGLGAALCLILVSMSLRAAGLGVTPQAELWRSGAYAADADLIQSTLHDLSLYKSGQPDQLQVAVVGIDSPALKWLLRDYTGVQYSDSIALAETPDIIFTRDQIQPAQSLTYRGQDFVWMAEPAWSQMSARDWGVWLLMCKSTPTNTKIILWARTDLFPGEAALPTAP